MNIMENYLTVTTNDGPMSVYVASLELKQTTPVVIILQEAFGVNHHIKDVCKRFAMQGYLVLAPELFHRQGKHTTVDYADKNTMMKMMSSLSNQGLKDDLTATFDFLDQIPFADSKSVFTVGFCMGGYTSMYAATFLPLLGSISFYGAGVVREREGIGFHPILNDLHKISSPLLLFYGEADVSIPESDRFEIKKVLDEASVSYEMMVFGEADHGFFCDERKVFNHSAARAAWKKTLEWMDELQATHHIDTERTVAKGSIVKNILIHVPYSEEN